MIPYSRSYVLESLMGGSQPGFAGVTWPPPSLSTHRPLSEPLDCSAWLTARGYLCIYNFKTPSLPLSFRLSTLVTCFYCYLVYTARILCLEIPTWRFCQRSICIHASGTTWWWWWWWYVSHFILPPSANLVDVI